jgi:hypothetical protein
MYWSGTLQTVLSRKSIDMSSPDKKRIVALRKNFNRIVRGAVRSHDIAEDMQIAITKSKRKNPIIGTVTNKRFSECVDGMVDSGQYMRSSTFVLNNIEHLHPVTLKKILSRDKTKVAKLLPTAKTPRKSTPVDEYDAAVIIRKMIKGTSPEMILELFPQYTRRQILQIFRRFKEKRTEKPTPGILGALLAIQKNRNNWF